MAATLSPDLSHDDKVARFTGGMASQLRDLAPFEGSERLRPDGRPRAAFRAELRQIPNAVNVFHVVFTLALPFAYSALAVAAGSWPLLLAIPTYGFVFVAMGSWFQRALTLNHEAAHRLLFSNKRWNDAIGEKLIGWLVFGDPVAESPREGLGIRIFLSELLEFCEWNLRLGTRRAPQTNICLIDPSRGVAQETFVYVANLLHVDVAEHVELLDSPTIGPQHGVPKWAAPVVAQDDAVHLTTDPDGSDRSPK